MIGNNVFSQAQGYQEQAGNIYGQMKKFKPGKVKGVGAVDYAQAPGQIDVDTLANMNLGAYMSPYQQQVIDAGQADIERQRQLAANTMGAAASRAGAFGGSRQGVQEGVLAGEALREAANLSAQQRQRGFETALQSAQFDIGNIQSARATDASQRFSAEQARQMAAETAAARQQAANMTNLESKFGVARMQQDAAGNLANLGSTMFGQGVIGLNQQQQASNAARLQEQQMLDAARNQLLMNLGYPASALQTGAGILQGLPSSTMTTGGNPGLVDFLGLVGGFG